MRLSRKCSTTPTEVKSQKTVFGTTDFALKIMYERKLCLLADWNYNLYDRCQNITACLITILMHYHYSQKNGNWKAHTFIPKGEDKISITVSKLSIFFWTYLQNSVPRSGSNRQGDFNI